MARGIQRQLIAVMLLTLSVLCGTTACQPRTHQPKESYRLTVEDKALFREGDIVLRRGEGLLSSFIVRQLHDTVPASHCGILVRHAGEWEVIHTLSLDVSETDGMQRCSLDAFMDDCVPGSLCVLRCLSDTSGCLASYARYYLAMQKPFDRQFNLSDTTAFFCSELPYRILKDRLKINLTPPDGSLKFSAFFNPSYFRVVYQGAAYGARD